MPVSYPYTQYSGKWTLQSQAQATAAGTWTGLPFGTLYGWGSNTNGKLGLGNTTSYSSPKQVGSLATWKVVKIAYNSHTLAIKNDGTLWSWGQNGNGQLGLNNRSYYSSPKQIGALTAWLTVSGSYFQSVAIKTNGTLWSWGANTVGQLGLGNTVAYSSPKQVGSLTDWLNVACGYNFTMAVKTDGTLWGWGGNINGQLGLGNRTAYSSPKQIGLLTNWSSASGSRNNFAAAIKTDGTLWMWGINGSGNLGQGNLTSYSSPKQVGSLTNWVSIDVSNTNEFAIATKTDGTLWGWGRGSNGQLGLNNNTSFSSPKQVGSLTNWLNVATGYAWVLSIKTDGTLWAWGENSQGQFGNGNTTNISSPIQIGALGNWLKVSASYKSTMAIAN